MSGPCAKQRVVCWIHGADQYTACGENLCENPQPVCPREPGEGYEKCQTVCRQVGHAEVQALENARRIGMNLRGAVAVVQGHTYACQGCQEELYEAGVAYIRVERDVTPMPPRAWRQGC